MSPRRPTCRPSRRAAAGLFAAAMVVALGVELGWPRPAGAVEEQVIAGLSQTHVSITADFSGSEIFIYGAVKRNGPPPKTWPLDIIVTVTGPEQPVIVRKKVHRFGIWVNGPGVRVDAAPSFYAVATTGSFHDIISYTDDLRYRIGLDQLVRLIGSPQDTAYPEDYREALIRLRRKSGLYVELPGTVQVKEQTLFDTRVRLPANLVEGDYRVRIFLLRDKNVIDHYGTSIQVRKVGMERWIYFMAQNHAVAYGTLSILVALVAGWLASTAFRLLLR